MSKFSFLLVVFLLSLSSVSMAQTATISGYIQDALTGEKLIGANVFDSETYDGTITNTYGFYSLTLPKGSKAITVSYIGYATQELTVDLSSDQTVTVELSVNNELQEIEIIAERQKNVAEESSMSTIDVPILQIKKVPALLGEVDVLKALQLLPGVQSGGEGSSGLYVRGGSPDQNLILLDGVPVYNVSHVFGFFSVFNPDAIKDVKLIKGGFPARYGGRLSSVLEINMKEGNMKEFHGAGSIGLVASKLTLEGPIKTDKTSFLISGRRTYIDLLARPLVSAGFRSEGEGTSGRVDAFFYDVNAKINHIFSEKDRLYFSVYGGQDRFGADVKEEDDNFLDENKGGLGWGNITSALRWNHLWSSKLFSNTSLTYSRYRLGTDVGIRSVDKVNDDSEEFVLEYESGIYDLAARLDFDYYPNPNHFIRFGVSAVNHSFEPGEFRLFAADGPFQIDTLLGQTNIQSQEYDLYVEDDMRITSKLKANVGLHYSGFSVQNTFYNSLQPRVSLRYLLSDNQSIKASFASMAQYINLLSSENIGLPSDIWVPSTAKIRPQESWQVALGYAFKLTKDLDVTVEGYYKEMKNLVSYKEGESFFDENLRDWGDRVTQGDGESYGGEVFIQKKTGVFTGWIGYTLSWTNRQFDDLNFGEKFPFTFDRRHDISVVGQYEISDRINIAATWVYGTGNAVTLANSTYKAIIPAVNSDNPIGREVEFYSSRNNFRVPAYHRFDIGINFSKQKSKHTRTWSFGAYNTYNRKNPFYVFLDTDVTFDQNNQRVETKSLKAQSLFPIVPYFNYSFSF